MKTVFSQIILPIICGIAANLITNLVTKNMGKSGPKHEEIPSIPKIVQATQFIVPVFVITVIYFSNYRQWVLNSVEKFLLIICAFILSMVIVAIYYWSLKKEWFSQMVIYSGVFFLAIALYLTDVVMPKYIKYYCPPLVENSEQIEGRVSDSLGRYHIYPVVYTPQGVAWLQQITQPDQNKKWSSKVHFGGHSGETYKFRVYASKKDLGLIGGRVLAAEDKEKLRCNDEIIEGVSTNVEVK